MTEKSYSKDYRFVLYQGDQIINEYLFNADHLNPITRNSVDIREKIPLITKELTNILSRRNLSYVDFEYNFLNEYKYASYNFGINEHQNKLATPSYKKITYNGKTIKGVECKFGLYINKHTIVEREFYVDRYNPASRFSSEIYDVIKDICDDIFSSLRKSDINYMWDDYYITNAYNIYSSQIRDFSESKRKEMLDNMSDPMYVKKIKSYLKNKNNKIVNA